MSQQPQNTSLASSAASTAAAGSAGSSNPASSSSSTQLEFSQAMTDFKVMFPDMEADVIEAVLRANNGAVDTTIDHLLAMSADNEAETSARDLLADADQPPPAYTGQPPTYNEAVTDDLINLEGASALPAASEKKSDVGPASVDLLSDFDDLSTNTKESEAVDQPQPVKYEHAYSHPKRQEADEQHYQQQTSSILVSVHNGFVKFA